MERGGAPAPGEPTAGLRPRAGLDRDGDMIDLTVGGVTAPGDADRGGKAVLR